MQRAASLPLLLLIVVTYAAHGHAGVLEDDAPRFKGAYVDTEPVATVTSWLLPLRTRDRHDVKTLRVVSVFGAKRNSYVRGHIHSGLDLAVRGKEGVAVDVMAMAQGVVCSIHLGPPHSTVVVRHKLSDGARLFTSYKHLGHVDVKTGQQVTADTVLGVLFDRKQARELGGNYDHLHLEVRKTFDDYGAASWATMSRKQLEQRFLDPLSFLRRRVKKL